VVQEPIFVARPGGSEEDDGWLLVMVFDGEAVSSELAVFDARRVSQGPVATVRLGHHVPLGLHGSFCREVLLPGDEKYSSAPQRFDIRSGV
jgi:all-trans-8'-apo-beta-carotenal 15,15'-oxygenase